jgi:hypothetical protein
MENQAEPPYGLRLFCITKPSALFELLTFTIKKDYAERGLVSMNLKSSRRHSLTNHPVPRHGAV